MSITQILRVMKLTAILLTVCCVQLMAAAGAQTISYSAKDVSLKEVFKVVKKQTGYFVVYNATQVNTNQQVTINAKDLPLIQFLSSVLKDKDLEYTIENKTIVISLKAKKQSAPIYPELGQRAQVSIIEIRGRVTDENGKPVVGASVQVRGTNKGTTTNENGEYILYGVDEKATLVVSAIGFEMREVAVNGRTKIPINVKTSINILDEVQMIAYGTTTKRYNTGSITTVKSEDIAKQPVSNPIAALQGRVPGLQISQGKGTPGSFFTIRLRGTNSIASGNDPLFIVDGVPFASSPFNNFGGAGANVSPFNNLNPQDIESIEVLKDADATAIYGSRAANGVVLISTKKGKSGRTRFGINYYSGIGSVARKIELLNTPQYLQMRREALKNDGLIPNATNAVDIMVWDTTRYTDWQEFFYKNSQYKDIEASISGGNNQTQFLLSGGHHKESTVFPGEFAEKKYSLKYQMSHNSVDGKLNINFNVSYNRYKNYLPISDLITTLLRLAPNAPAIYDNNGNLNWENSTWTNPYAQLKTEYRTRTDNILANMSLSYNLLPFLNFKTNFGFNTVNNGEISKTPSSANNPALNFSNNAGFFDSKVRTLLVEPQLQFLRKNSNSEIGFLVGATIQDNTQKQLLLGGTGYSSDNLMGSISGASSVTVSLDNESQYKYVGIFTRVNYNLLKKYIINLTARRDGSSRFGPEKQFSNFGAIGEAWIFSNEDIIKRKLPFISFGKLRSSYGTTGNDQIGDYKYLDTYSSYYLTYQGVRTFQPTRLYNPGYQWEMVRKFSLGVDLGLFNNFIMISADYYRNTTDNQLLNYSLPSLTGFNGIIQNLPAVVRNSGFEFLIDLLPIKSNDFKWQSSVNLSIPKNILVDYPNIQGSSYANTYVVGQPLSISKRFQWIGINPQTGQHTFTDFNNSGTITADDRQVAVNVSQQYFGGFLNKLSFRQWQVDLDFQFVSQRNNTGYKSLFGAPGAIGNQPLYVLNRWQAPGDQTDAPRFSTLNSTANTNYLNSDNAMENVSFIRLKNFSLAYLFNSKVIQRMHFQNARIFLLAQNVFTITSYKGLDPEVRTGTPPLRVITIGFQFNL